MGRGSGRGPGDYLRGALPSVNVVSACGVSQGTFTVSPGGRLLLQRLQVTTPDSLPPERPLARTMELSDRRVPERLLPLGAGALGLAAREET
ncbi:MAG: hypothetical protein U0821_08725 [Chloroflexota bacterium]